MAKIHLKKHQVGEHRCVCYAGGGSHPISSCGSSCQCCDQDRLAGGSYKQNRAEKAVPKKFGRRNQPLQPQTSAGTSYVVETAGSGNTPEKIVDLYPSNYDFLMTRNK